MNEYCEGKRRGYFFFNNNFRGLKKDDYIIGFRSVIKELIG